MSIKISQSCFLHVCWGRGVPSSIFYLAKSKHTPLRYTNSWLPSLTSQIVEVRGGNRWGFLETQQETWGFGFIVFLQKLSVQI